MENLIFKICLKVKVHLFEIKKLLSTFLFSIIICRKKNVWFAIDVLHFFQNSHIDPTAADYYLGFSSSFSDSDVQMEIMNFRPFDEVLTDFENNKDEMYNMYVISHEYDPSILADATMPTQIMASDEVMAGPMKDEIIKMGTEYYPTSNETNANAKVSMHA